LEGYSEATQSYSSIPLTAQPAEGEDPLVPSFWALAFPTVTTLSVYLDRDRPLSEPKWVKTGDVEEWLRNMFGRVLVGGTQGWERRIEVVDPDPAPTIQTILESWSFNSSIGTSKDRQAFVKSHMADSENVLEILLRLVRGERATPFAHAGPGAQASPVASGPLLHALSPSSPHANQQTHVSLAVLAIYRLAGEYAVEAGKRNEDVAERVGEILRCLPQHLLYKSLDGIFRERKVDKKASR